MSVSSFSLCDLPDDLLCHVFVIVMQMQVIFKKKRPPYDDTFKQEDKTSIQKPHVDFRVTMKRWCTIMPVDEMRARVMDALRPMRADFFQDVIDFSMHVMLHCDVKFHAGWFRVFELSMNWFYID